MNKTTYLIIGGGIAGTTAAETIRSSDPKGDITIVSSEPETLYSRVLLPKYLLGEIPFRKLYLRRLNDYQEKKIQLVKGLKASRIDTQKRIVYLQDGQEINFEKLLLASGAKGKRLSVAGSNLAGVYYLRTIADAQKIKRKIAKAKNALVVGGGFIGMNFLQIFRQANLSTTCLIRGQFYWERLVGKNIACSISQILEKNGVKIIPQTQIDKFLGKQKLTKVLLADGLVIPAEIVGVGIGAQVDLDYLKDSGLKTNKGIITNEYLEASKPCVWAAGDAAEFYDLIFSKRRQVGNWPNAAFQGRIAGANMVAGWGKRAIKDKRRKFLAVSAYSDTFFGASLSLLGDTSIENDIEIIERGSTAKGGLGRLYLREGKIVGAVLLNLPSEGPVLEELIRKHVKIKVGKSKLADIGFDLSGLANE